MILKRLHPRVSTKSGEHEFDVICFATGCDSVTGGLTQIGIRGVNGISIKDKWGNGCWTHLAMTSPGFKRYVLCLWAAGTNGFCNRTRVRRGTSRLIGKTLCYLRDNGYKSIDPEREAEEERKDHVKLHASAGLF
jgi:cyclohexanone monooxygenase